MELTRLNLECLKAKCLSKQSLVRYTPASLRASTGVELLIVATFYKTGDRVAVSPNFPEAKLRIVGLRVGECGTVAQVMRARPGAEGIAIVDWDSGRRTNANEGHLCVEAPREQD
jgi:hypothetical protein